MPASEPDEEGTRYIRRPALSAAVEETGTGTTVCTIFDPRGPRDPAEATRWISAEAGWYVEAAAIR
jgi:hypothetical protein